MSRSRPVVVALAVLGGLVAGVGLGACGIPSDDVARRQDPSAVPFDLLDPDPSTTSPPAGVPSTPRQVCLVDADGTLVPIERAVTPGTTLLELLRGLAEAPTPAERALGLASALPEPTDLLRVRTDAGVAVVELAPEAIGAGGRTALEAVAQVVCTLTAQPGVGQVQFEVDGTAVEVARGDGTTTSEPVSRADYAQLLARAG